MKENLKVIGEQPEVVDCNLNAEEQHDDLTNADNGSPISKFKSVEALSEAYKNLEKEFTQKCQKIKELTDKLANLENAEPLAPEYMQDGWSKKVKDFFASNPMAKNFVAEISDVLSSDDEIAKGKNSLENALTKVLANKFVPQEKLASDEEFLQKYIYSNDVISKKIVENYLQTLQQKKAMPLISGAGGAGTFSSPVKKPKTIKDAGKMVEAYLKN